jgi:hypothetical protein
MFQLKPLSKEALGRALEKAERYRLLNEPEEAESICLDILEVEPDDQKALVTLLLARTDRFIHGAGSLEVAREVLPRLKDEYERAYYAGIICERRASAVLVHGVPGSNFVAHDLLRQAMEEYGQAEVIRPPRNDDALLRWNTCARILNGNPNLRPRDDDRVEQPLE